MSGLILAGLGKGIADAGQTYGNAMFKQAEMDRQDERAAAREEALLKRQEALDELKAERERTREEGLQQRVIRESAAVGTKAAEIGAARETAQGEKDIKGLINRQTQIGGDSPAASEDEIRKLVEENPQYKEIYRSAGYIDKAPTANQRRMQRADDEVQASLDIGAHSSVQKSLLEKRKSVLDEIKEENKDADRKTERDQNNRRLDLMEERIASQNKTGQQNADANTMRANRPPSSGGRGVSGGESLDLRGLQTESTAASRAVTAARLSRDKQQGVVEKSFGEDKATAKTALTEANRKLAEAESNAAQVNRKISEFNTKRSGGLTAPKTGDNASTRPPLSSFAR